MDHMEKENRSGKTALIAMSGGVDSSVAAYIMHQKGYQCMGTTMRLFSNGEIHREGAHTCCSAKDVEDAAMVAEEIGIPYGVINMMDDFNEKIIQKFIRVYEEGGTPNPCIDCNRYMKFDKLMEFAHENGYDYIVTGHYARIEREETTGRWLLKKAVDSTKDQSYVLYSLTQDQLAHTQFPLGELRKTEVRKIAGALKFINADKHDSQDICFVPDGDYVEFIENYTGKAHAPGDFLDLQGNKIGTHQGAIGYTIGQRRGLHLAMGEHVYVCRKDMKNNTVTVGPGQALFSRTLIADDMNWISIPELSGPMRVAAKARYRQKEQPATVWPLKDGKIRLVFDEPQRALTVGQALVLYDGDVVVGGGTITEVPEEEPVGSAG